MWLLLLGGAVALGCMVRRWSLGSTVLGVPVLHATITSGFLYSALLVASELYILAQCWRLFLAVPVSCYLLRLIFVL